MTVAWDRIKSALVAHVTRARVVPAGHVFWEREAAAIAFQDVVELRILDERAHGFDDVEHVVTAGTASPRITGIREFTVSFRYSSRSHVTAARNGLERLRASFHHPTWQQLLVDEGVGLLFTEEIQTFDAVRDGRWESIAVLDVHFCTVSVFFDEITDPADSGAIEPLVSVVFTTSDDMPPGQPQSPPVIVTGSGRRVVA